MEDRVLIRYNHRNRGVHGVRGPVTRTQYGYRKSGDEFYVLRADAINAPNIFEIIESQDVVSEPLVVPAPPPPPVLIAGAEDEAGEELAPQAVLDHARFSLDTVPGLNESNVTALKAAGFVTPSSILQAGVSGLQKVKGIGPARAAQVVDYITNIYGE